MKAVLTSFGSMGDMQPMFALAVELRKCGHTPILALPSNFEKYAARLGLEFKKVGPDIKPENAKKYIINEKKDDIPDAIRNAKNFVETFSPAIPQMIEELSAACAGADILISTTFQFAAKIVSEKLNIPLVSIMLSHFSVNGSKFLRDSTAPLINKYREKAGLQPLYDPLTVDALSNELVLFAVSKYIMRKAQNWPDYYHVAGFFFLEEESFAPDPELREFLDGDSKPVIISFGSMVHENPEDTINTLIDAVVMSGNRAIIQKGWSGLSRKTLPSNIFIVDYLPHTWLFPRGSCIIHHGGAGTTAAAFYSGVPAIIVPHALDQPLWGQMGMALGCVSSVIPYQDLNAEKLSIAISETINNPKYAGKSIKMREKIRAESGVESARELIENLTLRKP